MKTTEFKSKMKRINKMYDKIDTIINSMPNHILDAMNNYHTEDATINHCTRWGLQASEELLKNAKDFIKDANKDY